MEVLIEKQNTYSHIQIQKRETGTETERRKRRNIMIHNAGKLSQILLLNFFSLEW